MRMKMEGDGLAVPKIGLVIVFAPADCHSTQKRLKVALEGSVCQPRQCQCHLQATVNNKAVAKTTESASIYNSTIWA
jgi:hypothetical protein